MQTERQTPVLEALGITKRYGFIYVDRDAFDLKDMKRIRKDSFYWYQKVCKSNGKDLD